MADIFVIDDQHPEDLAMLQALYSRSPASVVTHLEKLKQTGSGKFMDNYYVGYGHASIGDCGATTVFIEQVSMLVAKAVQDNPLYNGQEASTRYLDFSKQAIIDPYNNPASTAIQNRWMEIYNAVLSKLVAALEQQRPFDPTQYRSEKGWRNTLQARAFDIARSLLPLGTTTLLSWSTTLRQARDNLRRLKHHPLPEVREVARNIFTSITAKYPHSFKGDEMQDEAPTPRDTYTQKFASRDHFLAPEEATRRFGLTPAEDRQLRAGDIIARRNAIDIDSMKRLEGETLSTRPANVPLPWRLESYGRYQLLFLLDYGSFRDIQRHRNGYCSIPLVDGRYGMHPWCRQQFIDLLSPADAESLLRDIDAQYAAIAALAQKGVPVTPELNQYLYPMGTSALIQVTYSVPEVAYVGELRSGKTVHPSLRPIAQNMLRILAADLPGIALHGDMDEDDWSAKRGEQTITGKEKAA
ncbi:MAG: FAD-dependent thymidylate synthase [Alphaproteobacteria bacterium]|nr:FAD-dependent thymidylate synthase [Alphaproteobacteria bacterium]